VSEARPTLVKWVRRQLRGNPALTADELVELCRARAEQLGTPASEADVDVVRQVHAEEAAAAAERPAGRGNDLVGVGCLLVLLLNLIAGAALLLAPAIGNVAAIAYVGVVQLLYLVPLALWLRHVGRTATLQGVVLGAVLTFLLSAACFSLFRPSFALQA
jgi:Na+/proline symporter